MVDSEPLLSFREAAHAASVSVGAIQKAVERGELVARVRSGARGFDLREVTEWPIRRKPAISRAEFDVLVEELGRDVPMIPKLLEAMPDWTKWPEHLQAELCQRLGYRPETMFVRKGAV